MSELLIELLSEEIPARLQERAGEDFKRLVTNSLVDRGLTYEGARAFCSARRLTLFVTGLPAMTPDQVEERKGPRVDAPEQAIQGFLRSVGIKSREEATVVSDPNKGDYYTFKLDRSGTNTDRVVAEFLPEIIRKFPWPKSMRWGSGNLRWIRPLHSVLCTFGPTTEEPTVVEFELEGIPVGNVTRGHRFMDNDEIKVRRFDDYFTKLEKAKVVLDSKRRQEIILNDAQDQALALGLELYKDDRLLWETAGMVEWPVVLVGKFDEELLDIPEEVIRTTIREHQKCFVMRDPKTGKLTNRFVIVANIEASDKGKAIVAGNERVIAARLADAKFFWENDLKVPLETMAERLKGVVFHDRLGSVAERVKRIAAMSETLANLVEADTKMVKRAALLAKADLVSKLVIELPELQGQMGRYYAMNQEEDAAVADAVRDHYRPMGQSDEVPSKPVSIAVALADKLDILAGFWAIDEKPTGSRDPFALRRAALGLVSIILENGLKVPLRPLIIQNLELLVKGGLKLVKPRQSNELATEEEQQSIQAPGKKPESDKGDMKKLLHEISEDLLKFIASRIKVSLREQEVRHDLIDAVFSAEIPDDLSLAVKCVNALKTLMESKDGANLLVGYKRSANILRDEEKKGSIEIDGPLDHSLLKETTEKKMVEMLAQTKERTKIALKDKNFELVMREQAKLRPAVDNFFADILINAEEPDIRVNRLKILREFRDSILEVADFSKIEG